MSARSFTTSRDLVYSAKAYPGGYYTYDASGRLTGFAVFPQTPFRNAPYRVAALIREHSRAQTAFLATYKPFIDALKAAVPADPEGRRSWPLSRAEYHRTPAMRIEEVELTEALLDALLLVGVNTPIFAPQCLHPHVADFCRAWHAAFPDAPCYALYGGLETLKVTSAPAGCLVRYEAYDGLEKLDYVDASSFI